MRALIPCILKLAIVIVTPLFKKHWLVYFELIFWHVNYTQKSWYKDKQSWYKEINCQCGFWKVFPNVWFSLLKLVKCKNLLWWLWHSKPLKSSQKPCQVGIKIPILSMRKFGWGGWATCPMEPLDKWWPYTPTRRFWLTLQYNRYYPLSQGAP